MWKRKDVFPQCLNDVNIFLKRCICNGFEIIFFPPPSLYIIITYPNYRNAAFMLLEYGLKSILLTFYSRSGVLRDPFLIPLPPYPVLLLFHLHSFLHLITITTSSFTFLPCPSLPLSSSIVSAFLSLPHLLF